ncbi:hypothetical protein A8C56_02745 [Niabella ginsenosidivorans]|uniref:Uncharacterized protein n=1 Tax=Niabella ginsenosidivorans TaxID=1176587 RepID=A0A1A9HZZ1_9BACT|nr:hypothetical protein [Niabella ginsenosidivorans]ANH80041.1 hypothetical protein A8C56_02745 [Niabella ginsenosidivorans]
MKKIVLIAVILLGTFYNYAQSSDIYETSVTFPANYQAGDYIEFLKVTPFSAGASGYYEISISYTRGNIAAAATYLASIGHSNPNLWMEAGCVNANDYTAGARSFVVDCNPASGNVRFRVRAIGTYGIQADLPVLIKVRSINKTASWTALSATGNDLSVTKRLPMTREWNLYTGNGWKAGNTEPALAIRVIENGNVGLGIPNPAERLAVNGNIRAKEIKVETANWPDYVFKNSYRLKSLDEVAAFIKKNGHLDGVPPAEKVKNEGVALGANQAALLEKIEELTLYLIQQNEQIKQLQETVKRLEVQKRTFAGPASATWQVKDKKMLNY